MDGDLGAAARCSSEHVASDAPMPQCRPFVEGQRRARENFSMIADKLRTGRYDARGIDYWMEWLRVYRKEHRWYTQEIRSRQ